MRENGGQGVIKVVGTNLSERARPGRSNVRPVLVIEFERAFVRTRGTCLNSAAAGVFERCCGRGRAMPLGFHAFIPEDA